VSVLSGGRSAEAASSFGVSVMIFTLDEEINLPACLGSLAWCDDIIVVDSFSKDRTEQIAREAGARFFQNKFQGFGTQRNWALDHCEPKHAWVLVLDADERVPPELAEEMRDAVATAPDSAGAFKVRRRFYLWGRWLQHSSLYPTWVVRLVHRDRVRYENRGHAETQTVDGEIRSLEHDLIDENAKGIDDWLARQLRYAKKEAEFELANEAKGQGLSSLLASEPLERRAALKRLGSGLPGRAGFYFLYAYFVRRGFLDGRDGLMFCTMKALYQQMIVVQKYTLAKGRS
jgi:glycosyltransferase involved in cell wall biosynthesis